MHTFHDLRARSRPDLLTVFKKRKLGNMTGLSQLLVTCNLILHTHSHSQIIIIIIIIINIIIIIIITMMTLLLTVHSVFSLKGGSPS